MVTGIIIAIKGKFLKEMFLVSKAFAPQILHNKIPH
jgi:hypothetical protein